MNQEQKNILLSSAREHVADIRGVIDRSLDATTQQIVKGKEDFKILSASDQVTASMLLAYGKKRLEELKTLRPTPYFVRCDVLLEGDPKPRSIYFAKFPLSEREIYSWTAPVATIRFENIGAVSYTLPDGEKQNGQLLRRDQFMIVDGNIVFMATESEEAARELVYQEHFSSRKQGFMLPEIVAQMEKAQDRVIRAHHVGPFAISGPAGSGKTTLALHRVAYLVQSPDTAYLYPSDSIIVFVQDAGTEQYFSQLLPELGIRDVHITTYDKWAFDILEFSGKFEYVRHIGETESERDRYEYVKLQALRSCKFPAFSKQPFAFLEELYAPYLDEKLTELFRQQKKRRILDRTDLTALLSAHAERYGDIGKVRNYYVEQKNGTLKKKRGRVPFEYPLIVVDEFQNSLPEQLQLFKRCISPKLRSIVYVGDMAQKIHFGTIRQWEEIGEDMSGDRAVMLQKVYRNTKNILRYIQSLGYDVEIPEGMREGEPVQEYVAKSVAEEIDYVRNLIAKNKKTRIGILAKHDAYLAPFREAFGNEKEVHIFTMEESQGVEFDIVCIVGMNKEDWKVGATTNMDQSFVEEKQKILKDLLYVALTRAISELHVVG